VEHLRRSLRCPTAAVYLRATGAARLAAGAARLAAAYGEPPAVLAGYPDTVPTGHPVADVVAGGAPLLDRPAGAGGACVLPLAVGGRILGAVAAAAPTLGLAGGTAQADLETVATQAAQALDRALLLARLADVSAGLQRGLVPEDAPHVPGLCLAAVYRPGGDDVEEVGGDWYDVLPLGDGRVALVVGDVMGRGVRAATTMAAVRAAVRAYALLDPDPATVLCRLDRFVGGHVPQEIVTICYVAVDPAGGRASVGLAGHPPPLLVAGGTARLLDTEPGPPLGLGGERVAAPLRLDRGDTLVILTDGVVEDRHSQLTDGLERATRLCAELADRPCHEVAAALAGIPAGSDDDVTVLVARRDA
jgi:serine phosphatase RsbU (regulator of sigma subunit)